MTDHANTRGSKKQLVARSSLHDLGIARHDLHTCLTRRASHRLRHPTQQLDRQPFLNDRGARQIKWHSTSHREVVDRPTPGKLTDIAAWKLQWIDDERVGREREPIAILC